MTEWLKYKPLCIFKNNYINFGTKLNIRTVNHFSRISKYHFHVLMAPTEVSSPQLNWLSWVLGIEVSICTITDVWSSNKCSSLYLLPLSRIPTPRGKDITIVFLKKIDMGCAIQIIIYQSRKCSRGFWKSINMRELLERRLNYVKSM